MICERVVDSVVTHVQASKAIPEALHIESMTNEDISKSTLLQMFSKREQPCDELDPEFSFPDINQHGFVEEDDENSGAKEAAGVDKERNAEAAAADDESPGEDYES